MTPPRHAKSIVKSAEFVDRPALPVSNVGRHEGSSLSEAPVIDFTLWI